jgi:hypothetical protein
MSLTVILAMLPTSLALADNVQNDVTAGGNDIIIVGGSTTVNHRITANHVNAVPPLADTTPPVITPIEVGWMGENGWYASMVTVSWSVVDDESSISSSSGCDPTTIYPDTAGTTLTCSATSEGGTSSESVTIRIDVSPPSIYGSASPAPNSAGWNNTDVTVSFTCDDATSGVMYCEPDWIFSDEGAGQGVLGRAVDYAWNDERMGVWGINIDKTPPTVSLVGGPANSGTYYFGFVPTAPTCSASDGLSGLDGSCSVSGYSTAVGSHTVTASATDKAGNSARASAAYSVLAWSLTGFYAPVDMNGVYNVVGSGRRVPLKFELFAGTTELSDTSAVKSLTSALVPCSTGTKDAIKETASATGGMALRYDTTAGQFIQNWQTPRQAGACYRVTMMTQDGSSLVAFFRLK